MNYINLKERCDNNVPGNTFDDFTEDTGGKTPGTNNQISDEVQCTNTLLLTLRLSLKCCNSGRDESDEPSVDFTRLNVVTFIVD